MIKQLKQFTINLIAGGNIATVLLMLLVGYSDHISPADHPLLSTMGMALPVFLVVNLLFLFFWLTFKWRMAWIPVVGYLLAYIPINIYMPINFGPAPPADAIKLVSYNVCCYGGNYKYENGFGKVYEYLCDEQPDIICLQEDVDVWRRYVFQEYAKNFAYNDTCVLAKNASTFNALGIHTRFPIIHRERIPYSSASNGSVAWWLNVQGDTLIVVNNHFESCHLNSNDRRQYRQIIKGEMSRDSARNESKVLLVKLAEANAKRAPQIDAVLQYVEAHSQYPVIVCGDFNDNPISFSRHRMAERLTDCYVASGRGIGLSYNQKAFALRIDHIFCSKDIQPYQCKVDGKMDASDHNPMTCWLKIDRKHSKKHENPR